MMLVTEKLYDCEYRRVKAKLVFLIEKYIFSYSSAYSAAHRQVYKFMVNIYLSLLSPNTGRCLIYISKPSTS